VPHALPEATKVRVKSLFAAFVVIAVVVMWGTPVLAQGTGSQETKAAGQQPTSEVTTKPAEPPKPAAPAPPPPSPFTFALRGFISGSVFVQDGVLAGAAGIPGIGGSTGSGQGALFAASEGSTDTLMFSGDVRQTRLNFSMKGPAVLGGATPTGVLELDFLGGFSGGAFGDDSILPRVRLAYVEAAWPTTTLRVGQFHNLVVAFIPASAAHIAFPYATAAGFIGWRSPGVTLLERVPVGAMNLELGVQANRDNWNDTAASCAATQTPEANGCLRTGVALGEASGLPQIQARVSLTGGKTPSPWPLYPPGDFVVFVAGNWDQKDRNGWGAPGGEPITTLAVQGGAKVQFGPLLVAANGWWGQNAGNMLGHIIQFAGPGAIVPSEDISGFGVWGQLGFNLSKELALWAFAGTDRPDPDQAQATSLVRRHQNVFSGMLSYKDGPYAAGLEWVHWSTGTVGTTATGGVVDVNQVSGTVTYFF
jgi:hypothetical protein